jgi:long-subunit fatty acid transport protein
VEEYEHLKGENVTAGIFWNVNPRWNLALRYDSAFVGDIDFKSYLLSTVATAPPMYEHRKMSFPESWTVAAAYRPFDKLTIAGQISRTDWDDFYIKTAGGDKFSLVDGRDFTDPSYTDFKPTYNVRVGAEYVLIPDNTDAELDYLWTLRGGLFLDQEPASGARTLGAVTPGDGKPDNFYGIAFGVGLQAFNRVNVDVAYQARYGRGVNADQIRGLNEFEEDILTQRFIVSTVIYF